MVVVQTFIGKLQFPGWYLYFGEWLHKTFEKLYMGNKKLRMLSRNYPSVAATSIVIIICLVVVLIMATIDIAYCFIVKPLLIGRPDDPVIVSSTDNKKIETEGNLDTHDNPEFFLADGETEEMSSNDKKTEKKKKVSKRRTKK